MVDLMVIIFQTVQSLLTMQIVQNATDSTKLPLSGGTLTGTLNGTVATFSSNIDSQYNYFAYVEIYQVK
jgi:hypothetical protein